MSLLIWPRNIICIGVWWNLENTNGPDDTAEKIGSESPFLAEMYTELISLPVHEQLLRYAERLAFIPKPFVCTCTCGSCFHIVVSEIEGTL